MTPDTCRDTIVALVAALSPASQVSAIDRFAWVRSRPTRDRQYTLAPIAGEHRPPGRTLSGLRRVLWELVAYYGPADDASVTASDDAGQLVDLIESLMVDVDAIEEAWLEGDPSLLPDDEDAVALTIRFYTVFRLEG